MDTTLNLRDIEKITISQLASCQFAKDEIYTRDEDKRVRFLSLDKALTMSHHESLNCLLVIHTINGFKALQTKVLELTLTGIRIEGNMFIPLHAIYSANIE